MSLRAKLVIAFLLLALASVALVAVVVAWSTPRQFGDYVFRREGELGLSLLQEHYAEVGNWEGLNQRFASGAPFIGRGRGGPGMGPGVAVVNKEGRVVLQGAGFAPDQRVPASLLQNGIPIEVDGEVVGTIVGPPQPVDFLTPAGLSFLNRARRAIILGVVAAGALALVAGWVLSGRMTSSISELEQATRAVSAGELGRQVEVRSDDEVGRLARSFNQMSLDLAREEDLRRQMTADIAHELRNPLSLILGHSEALLDGMLPRNEENLRIVNDEARHLGRIVDDLRTLSLAEAGELALSIQMHSLGDLVTRTVKARKPMARDKDIHFRLDLDIENDEIEVDGDRVIQAVGNVLDNAIRYTPHGGSIRVLTGASTKGLQLAVTDGGPGISEEDLGRLFHRFYRGDEARSRAEGGSGLGLAIAKSLVEAHDGRIWAENATEGGARFVIELPQPRDSRGG